MSRSKRNASTKSHPNQTKVPYVPIKPVSFKAPPPTHDMGRGPGLNALQEAIQGAHSNLQLIAGCRDALIRTISETQLALMYHLEVEPELVYDVGEGGVNVQYYEPRKPFDADSEDLVAAFKDEIEVLAARLRRIQPQVAIAALEIVEASDIFGYSKIPAQPGVDPYLPDDGAPDGADSTVPTEAKQTVADAERLAGIGVD